MKIEYYMADTSGNKTLFVTTPVARENYSSIALYLLENCETAGEQVAFVKASQRDCDGAFEMCGLEFCCNATRAYGYMIARDSGHLPLSATTIRVWIRTSGMSSPLAVTADLPGEYASVEIPAPELLDEFDFPWNNSSLTVYPVLMDGILHLILPGIPPDPDLADALVSEGMKRWNPPALGLMYYDGEAGKMVPAVFVRDVKTLYWEGSCGSGTAALAWYLGSLLDEAELAYRIDQPLGILESHVKKDGPSGSVSVGGPVRLEGPFIVETP